MITEKLYYTDPYQFAFQARVVSSVVHQQKIGVILDRTCFYPEGGGQPSDQGFLNQVRVYDVRMVERDLIHFVEYNIPPGIVSGQVDENRRRDYMQQHTGQHIVSQALVRVGKFNTVSVHFGEDYTAIETDAPLIEQSELDQVEQLANAIVCSNLPVRIQWVNPQDVEKYQIRRPPPDVDKVRIVQVSDFDASACGGLHVSRTGEVGLIKIIGWEKIRNHIRIQAKIGERAYRDYRSKTLLVQQLGQFLTCGEDGMMQRVTDMATQLRDTRRDLLRVQTEVALSAARTALGEAPTIQGIRLVWHIFENAESKVLKAFIDEIMQEENCIALAFSVNDQQLLWMISHRIGDHFNLSKVVSPFLRLIGGRGGGNSVMMQGGGQVPAGITEFIDQLKHYLERELAK